MSDDFGTRLREAMRERGPLCAGIDPHASLLAAWDLPDTVDGLERFALTAAEALAPEVAAVKPQSAFFERFGSRGVAVLEQVVATSREAGAQVVLDVKRGDIGSTAQGYADAYLDPASPLAVDAITVSPYLGVGSLGPVFETARRHGTGAFVLALTSNPEAPAFQQAVTADGRTVAGSVLDALRELNAATWGHGSFGAVVGATIGDTAEDLDVGGPLLVPGLGAQGGTADDVRRIFAGVLDRVLASSSREVLGPGPDPTALRDAARRTSEELGRLTERGA
ncbi:orotidine-5'-phosphate decarboxylase [Nocardioides aequoreus]|uniref:orotidine-5'-phosphate decarboxylase n=1 Tax=Nocardioides aequoreus TaxID=397278 RepID=UPI0004C32B52|nr:orotidine-5'-phosphate decarboxylase [Nocardioides aequoreus]